MISESDKFYVAFPQDDAFGGGSVRLQCGWSSGGLRGDRTYTQ